MQDLNDKITGNTLTAAEWNEVPSEIQNVIEGLGITLSAGDLDQLGKGIAGYVANSQFYTDSGAANAYVLSKIGSKQTAPAYTNGFTVRFLASATNTGASTINVSSLGVKNIKLLDGSDPAAGTIVINKYIDLVYDGTNFVLNTDVVITEINAPGGLDLVTGQIKFPATQNPSSDVNTLDDYEEGSFTPVITFDTPGDVNMSYSEQDGAYVKIGKLCIMAWRINGTITHTTAAGELKMTGQPFPSGITQNPQGAVSWQTFNFPSDNWQQVTSHHVSMDTHVKFNASGSQQTIRRVGVADVPTSSSFTVRGSAVYITDA